MNLNLLNEFQSPYDDRDFIVEAIVNPVQDYPETLDLRPDLPEVWDQGDDGPCSAYSAAAIKNWQEKIDYGLTEKLSPYFVYDLRSNKPQSGMFPRDTMKILNNYGIPTKKTYDTVKRGNVNSNKFSIPQNVFDEAAKHKIKGYARVSTIDGLKKSLYKNGPAYIAMPVFNGDVNFWKPKFGEKMIGGHALVIVGYTDTGFILRNSWGKRWADRGHSVYPYSDWGSHWEIWSMIDENTSDIKPVSNKSKSKNSILNLIRKIFA
jgi:C1A family cysteine protease